MAPCRPVNHLLFHERRNFGNQKIIREIKRRNFGNQKLIREIKRTNFGNQKIIQEIKRTRQESKHIIILVILLEHRSNGQKICNVTLKSTGKEQSNTLYSFLSSEILILLSSSLFCLSFGHSLLQMRAKLERVGELYAE